uniref:Pigment dispersing hormone n=1 Tax=Talitrus saltator TaxID=191375 RepID=L7PI19_9CRUS|nr:pigment dispersing hormone [Talitrus saltator]
MLSTTVAVWSAVVMLGCVAGGQDLGDLGSAPLTVPQRLAISDWAQSIARLADGGLDGPSGLSRRLELLQQQVELGNLGGWRGSDRLSYGSTRPHDKRNSELINSLLGLPKFLREPLNASKNHARSSNGQ